jgi:nucleoside phosphorylase
MPGCAGAVGRLEGTPVVLGRTGDGARNAERGARTLLDLYPVSCIIIVGLAGGLTASLRPGCVLAAREVVDEDRPAPRPDAAWLERAMGASGAIPAIFVSTPGLLCTASAKTEARGRLPRGAIAAVDLETATFARIAAARGLPYLALRTVSDPAEESLPLDFNDLRDASGAVDRRRVVIRAILRPRLIPPLWRLHRRMAQCSENLAAAVCASLAGDAS